MLQSPKLDKSKQKIWTVTIRFDLDGLGPMLAQVSLKGDRISTHVFAEEVATAQLLRDNIQHLTKSLTSAGVNVEKVEACQGLVPTELLSNTENVIDLQA